MPVDALRDLLQRFKSVKTWRLCLQLGGEASPRPVAKLDPATLSTGSGRP
ncbi:type IV toxin-antitoxin system AbiEi family antitoxin domain-containing protein [Paucibacter sp. PLA-PC-4]|nr:type IV toxin-antitoxin system AbiEi family antitoxin domain-containing protein [Paucibacter sp. PLA-PC-4]MCX2863320.1 type IV toxin-antitoxin system AbiEi family antitoxin domain-containing protein [Paucibacter sp. PLA-PC-4]